jgi:BolA protein
MALRHERIRSELERALGPEHLEVIDESGMHNVPAGAESHFRVVVVSRAFADKAPVARHQLVYGALRSELGQGLHALAIVAKTPEEWAAAPDGGASPECRGGSKR